VRGRLFAAGLLILPLGVALPVGGAAERAAFTVEGLRCEYLSDPSGIDVERPRLSWSLGPANGGQSGYRILVASTPAILQSDRGDLWDSGRVASTQTTWLEYAGQKLASGQRVHWKVRVWDDAGEPSPWSAPATWSMGLLRASDWTARWIGERRPEGTAEGRSPGFQHFVVEPSVVGDLTFAKASYRSIHGEIVSDWRIEDGTFRLSVTVPPGTTATVVVPGEGPIRTQTGRPASTGMGSSRSFEVGPGIHAFATSYQPRP
jgi:hypothetical protein